MRSAWTQALLLLAGTAWAVSAANTPGRQVTIAGMRLNTWAYQEKSATNPLDDISLALSASAETAVLCYSTWYPVTTWNMFVHVPSVAWPNIWYFPMSTLIGSWPLQAGDNLVCELWECDGGVGGCDPAKPSLLPNATAGDDRLGELTLGMDDYAAQLTLTSSFNTSATNAAAGVMLECDKCWQLWRDNNGAWVNPYRQGDLPASMRSGAGISPPPAPPAGAAGSWLVAGQAGAAPESGAAPKEDAAKPAANAPVAAAPAPATSAPRAAAPSPTLESGSPRSTPSASPTAPAPPSPARQQVLAPVPSPPAPQEVTSFDGPDESPSPVEQSPATAESPAPADAPVKGGGLATGVIAAIGAVVGLLALLAIGTTIYCARRGKCCFGRGKVSPETAPSDAEAQAEDPALHVNVRKPKHALPLMRAANASAATVTTPWAPDLLEGRSDP